MPEGLEWLKRMSFHFTAKSGAEYISRDICFAPEKYKAGTIHLFPKRKRASMASVYVIILNTTLVIACASSCYCGILSSLRATRGNLISDISILLLHNCNFFLTEKSSAGKRIAYLAVP